MFDKTVYINRRKRLKEIMKSGVLLFMGNNEAPMNYTDNTYIYRQDSTFLYFFGIDEPGMAAIIDVDNNKEILFGNDLTLADIIWMGTHPTMSEKAASCGVDESMPFDKLATTITEALDKKRNVHYLPPYRHDNIILLSDLFNIHHTKVKESPSLALTKACIELRSVKEAIEIEEMEKQTAAAYEMYIAAMKMAQPGVSEKEITGVIEGIAASKGHTISFPVICSVRGETLHNHVHKNILKKGDLLLIDAGCESFSHYATDNTRTMPVGGTFSQQQREIYEIVLNNIDTTIAATKPGLKTKDLHLMADKTIASGLKKLGIMKGDVDEAVAQGAHALFFPHGLGHMIGLDVHDMEDYNDTLVGYDEEVTRSTQFGLAYLRLGRRLQENFVITNEPGIYFIPALIDTWKKENKHTDFINYSALDAYKGFGGIRLEDDVLVTDKGARVLGKRIPITVDEVEQAVASGV